MTDERDIPNDIPAERAVLGCVLLDGSCLPELQSLLNTADFYGSSHRRIWEAAVAVQEASGEPDIVTVRAELVRSGHLKECGGLAYLSKLVSSIPSSSQSPTYAAAVKKASDLRGLIACGEKLSAEAFARSDPDELRSSVVNLLSVNANGHSCWEEIAEVARRYSERGPAERGFDIGLKDLQYSTGGLYEGLNVIAGMPGAGKTTLACQLVNRAIESGHKVSIVSMDQKREDLFGIMWCNMAGQQEDQLNEHGYDAYSKLVEANCRFYRGKFSLQKITGALRLNASLGYKWVLVDYLGLISVQNARSQHEAAEMAAKTLKTLAHELGLTILLIVSFVKRDGGAAPGMSDVRGTMEVAHAPEQMWILEPGKEPNDPVVCHIVKSRKRGKGRVQLDLRGAIRRFADWNDYDDVGRGRVASGGPDRIHKEGRFKRSVVPFKEVQQAGTADDSRSGEENQSKATDDGSIIDQEYSEELF